MKRLLGTARRWSVTVLAFALVAGVVLTVDLPASGGLVPTVSMGTAADFAVLGSSTVTNTGFTTIDGNVGLWPGTSVTGFPPGVLVPPGSIGAGTPPAHQAQTDPAAAYTDAAGRTTDSATPAQLGGQTLLPGVYGAPAKDALLLTGSLVLDGANDPNSVFIFQTDTTLTTASASTVTLINGAQECNVFWQIGSSATLGTNSSLAGNILASTSITLTTGAVLRGRALALGAAVTMDTNTIVAPSCDLSPPVTTTTTLVPATTTTTLPPATTTTTTAPAPTTTTLPPATTTTTTAPAPTTTTTSVPATTTTTTTTRPPATTTTSAPAATTPTTSGSDPPPTTAGPRVPTSTFAPGVRAAATPRSPTAVKLTDPGVPALRGPPRTGGAPLRKEHGFPWLPVLFAVTLFGAGLAAIPTARRARRA